MTDVFPGDVPPRDIGRRFAAAVPSPDRFSSLREELAVDASRRGLVDVGYGDVNSPVGRLFVAVTPRGVARIAFEHEEVGDVLAELARAFGPRVLWAPGLVEETAAQIADYFGGSRTHFDIPVDLGLSSGFHRLVQAHLAEIPYGQTRTYKEVADEVGNAGAVRAVGSACARNPVPIILPCHRVRRSDGRLGGYRGGIDAKRLLLDLELGGT